MSSAWTVTVLKDTKDGNVVTDRTVVYADDQIEATKLGIAALGTTSITVQEIPAEHGGQIPSDAELNALQAQYRQDVGGDPEELRTQMKGSGGQAYG